MSKPTPTIHLFTPAEANFVLHQGVTKTVSLCRPVTLTLAALAAGVFALYEVWRTNFLGLRDIALQAFQGIAAFVQTQFGVIKKPFDEILPLLKQTTASALAEIQKFWAAHGQEIIAVVKSMWEIIKVVVSTAVQLIGNTIKLILQVINGDWTDAWETAKNIVVIVARAIIGLVNGINASAALAYNKMKDLAAGALQAAKSVLGISSPSKEMQIIGEFVAVERDADHRRIRRRGLCVRAGQIADERRKGDPPTGQRELERSQKRNRHAHGGNRGVARRAAETIPGRRPNRTIEHAQE